MSGTLTKIQDKLEQAGEKSVEFIVSHPIKTLLVLFVVVISIRWIKDLFTPDNR